MTVAATPCVCAAFRKAARALTLLYDAHLRPAGLRSTQYSLLKHVLAHQPTGVSRLAEAMVTDRTTLTRNVRLLERRGLVEIQAGADRRARSITITPRGRAAVAKATPAWERAQAYVLGQVGAEHWGVLRGELDLVIALGCRRAGPRPLKR